MFNFNKKEMVGFICILLFTAIATYLNILVSYRNERDVLRNLNISQIAQAVEKYNSEYGVYPLSTDDGKILACKGEETGILTDENNLPQKNPDAKKYLVSGYVPCQWGKDALQDVTDLSYPKYIDVLPEDPQTKSGVNYVYISDGKSYKILASYEGRTLSDYSQKVANMKVFCGIRMCNVGRRTGVINL